MKFYYDGDGKIYLTEGKYFAADFPVTDLDFEYNNKIGALDFETHGGGCPCFARKMV